MEAFAQNEPAAQSISAVDLASQYEPALHRISVEGFGQNDPNGQSASTVTPATQYEPVTHSIAVAGFGQYNPTAQGNGAGDFMHSLTV